MARSHLARTHPPDLPAEVTTSRLARLAWTIVLLALAAGVIFAAWGR